MATKEIKNRPVMVQATGACYLQFQQLIWMIKMCCASNVKVQNHKPVLHIIVEPTDHTHQYDYDAIKF